MMMKGQCYDGGHTSAALTVILGTGESWVMPWHRFLHARLDGEKFFVTFAEYRVEIHGRNLAQLFEHVSNLKLSAIRELPAPYSAAFEPKDLFIAKIQVTQCRTDEGP